MVKYFLSTFRGQSELGQKLKVQGFFRSNHKECFYELTFIGDFQ